MKGLLILPLALCCLGGTAIAAPFQDPANVDAAQAPDPANTSARRAPDKSTSWLPSFGTASREPRSSQTANGYVGRAADAMPSLSADDYRQAYGSSDIRSRLGRVYNAGGSSTGSLSGGTGLGWLDQVSSGFGSSFGGMSGGMGQLSETAQPIRNAMDDISRQLMPALQEMRNNVGSELDQASRKSR